MDSYTGMGWSGRLQLRDWTAKFRYILGTEIATSIADLEEHEAVTQNDVIDPKGNNI